MNHEPNASLCCQHLLLANPDSFLQKINIHHIILLHHHHAFPRFSRPSSNRSKKTTANFSSRHFHLQLYFQVLGGWLQLQITLHELLHTVKTKVKNDESSQTESSNQACNSFEPRWCYFNPSNIILYLVGYAIEKFGFSSAVATKC